MRPRSVASVLALGLVCGVRNGGAPGPEGQVDPMVRVPRHRLRGVSVAEQEIVEREIVRAVAPRARRASAPPRRARRT